MMTNTTTTDRADFSNAQHLRDFVERVAEWLTGTYACQIVDFGADNLCRPPAITFAPELPAGMQPRIYFRYRAAGRAQNSGRLTISAGWPAADGDGGWGRPTKSDLNGVFTEISVTSDKPAAQVARDIANRLLPTWLPLHEELRRRITDHQSYDARAIELAKRLGQEGTWITFGRDRAGFCEYLRSPDERYDETGDGRFARIELAARGDGRVKIELDDLDEAQAAAVLALLRGGVDPGEVAKLRAEVQRLTEEYNRTLWGAK